MKLASQPRPTCPRKTILKSGHHPKFFAAPQMALVRCAFHTAKALVKTFENQKPSLRYKRARMYSAQLGRFISRDPLGFVDGMSLYRAYFVPNGVDPSGMECKSKARFGREISDDDGAFTFYLEINGASSDCCNVDTFDVDTKLFNPVFGVINLPLGILSRCRIGIVVAFKNRPDERERLDPLPEDECNRNPCPCPEGVECVTALYTYKCGLLGILVADGFLWGTFCADGSFSSGGWATKYELDWFGGDVTFFGKEHVYESIGCEPEY